MLEARQLLSATVLFSDQFGSSNSMNINSDLTNANRQSGELGTATYSESALTRTGGSLDYLSQVNNGAGPKSALLGVRPGLGLTDSFLSPDIDFAKVADVSHVEVTVTPLGLGSTSVDNTGHWAGLEIGAAQGTSPMAGGTGLMITQDGTWRLYDNGTSLASGSVGTATSYTLAIDLTSKTGDFVVSINGSTVYSGNHGTPYTTNYISLASHSSSNAAGYQLDYFGNLLVLGEQVTTNPEPQPTLINLLTDSFTAPSNLMDINQLVATRQEGLFAGTTYLESATTKPTPTWVTQVNNGAMRNTLLLGNSSTQKTATVTPNGNFFDPRLALSSFSVDVTPLGPATNDTSFKDHWAGIALGGPAGAFVQQAGVSGLLIRTGGSYAVFENGVQVASGGVAASTTYNLKYTINPTTASYQVSVNGKVVYTGTHVGGFNARDRITLQNLTTGNTTGLQLDYFDNLQILGQGSPYLTSANTTFYISPTGSDDNDGTSALTPWKTLDRANQELLRSGDQFLFEGGSTFTGKLTITSDESGTANAPIVIGSYGTGKATINSGADNAIELNRAKHVTVSNLNLVGAGYNVNPNNSGVLATSDLNMPTTGITISGVDSSGYGDSGIKFVGDFNNVSITDSSLHDNGNGGLWMSNSGGTYSQNIYIGNVTASHNVGSLTQPESGYGILLAQVQGGVIERSTAINNGWLSGNIGLTGGIEVIHTDRILIQYNEAAFNHRGQADGDGIIVDSSTNTITQFNYTHDNDGAGLFLGAESGTRSDQNVIRYNVSQNDARFGSNYSGIHVWQDVNNSEIYNNTVYMSDSASAAVAMSTFLGKNLEFRNNLLVSSGGSPLVYYRGGGAGVVFQGNEYWSSDGPFHIYWIGNDYTSLSAFQSGSGQELVGTTPTGFQVAPGLLAPGTGGTINNSDLLTSLTAYILSPTSPLNNGGLDLDQFSISWDPQSFASDPFLSQYFSSTQQDYYGNVLPAVGTGNLSVGAYQG